MDEQKPHKRQTTKLSRSARNKRIVERLRAGFGYDEIAREERLTGRRVRQIVKQALEGREALESAIHAHMQIDRLGQALRVAGDALAEGDIRAVAPFIKALEKLDHYQSLAPEAAPRREATAGDKMVMNLIVDRIRSEVLDECRREPAVDAAAAAAAAGAAPPPDPGPGADEARAAAAPPIAPEPQPPLAPELLPAPPPSAPPLWRPPVSPFGTWPGPREARSPGQNRP